MDISPNEYLPGDQRLVDKIVYELKSQGIFDQFRKECFADVDTKPAYQNLRQRVEGSVSGFLKDQSWRPDMNKNQVREMLRKTIFELGFLETGVERIVDQVVNPKINSVFLPKVEEIVYRYLGVQKPGRSDEKKPKEIEPIDLLPTDLEAVSPESDPGDKKEEQEKSNGSIQNLDDSKADEDESPPFEPLDEPILQQEENSVDSHFSGYSGLVSHESGNDSKILDLCLQESQMSQNSSDSRLSTLASDENSKMDVCEDTSKSGDFTKDKGKESHKSSSDKIRSQNDKDRKRSRDGKSSSSRDRSRDSKVSSRSDDKDRKDRRKSESDKNKGSGSGGSNNRHSSSASKSNSKEKPDTHRHERDKYDKNKSHKDRDSKGKDKNSDSKLKSSTSKRDDKYHSSSKRDDKSYKKKGKDSKDDHYSMKNKAVDRRSTDRDSDGQSSKYNFSSSLSQSNSQSQKNNGQEQSGSNGNGNGDPADQGETKVREQKLKVMKPKYASNIQEAMKLMKIRRQLAKLEKQNQLSLATVEVNSTLMSSSINLDDLARSREEEERNKLKDMNNKIVAELETVPTPLPNTVISQNNWDEMEAKLLKEVCSEFSEVGRDDSFEEQVNKETDLKHEEAAEHIETEEETVEEEELEAITEEEILEIGDDKVPVVAQKEEILTNEDTNANIDEDVVEANKEKAVEASEEKALEASEERPVEASEEKAVEACKEKPAEASKERPVEASGLKTEATNDEDTLEAAEEKIGDSKKKPVEASEDKITNAVEMVMEATGVEKIAERDEEVCKYFEEVDISKIEFLQFVNNFLERNKDVSGKGTVKNALTKEAPLKRKLETANNNNNMSLGTGTPEKKRKVTGIKKTKQVTSLIDEATDEMVPLASNTLVNGNDVSRPKAKSKIVTKAAKNQRYSSDDLYKPRPSFSSSRRRGPKNTNI